MVGSPKRRRLEEMGLPPTQRRPLPARIRPPPQEGQDALRQQTGRPPARVGRGRDFLWVHVEHGSCAEGQVLRKLLRRLQGRSQGPSSGASLRPARVFRSTRNSGTDGGFAGHSQRDGTKIKEFTKCDFQPIFDYFEIEREKKKSLTKEEKKALKTQKDELEEPFKYCLLDGRKEKVGNFRVEPPSLFRGRGEHPKTGMLKVRRRLKRGSRGKTG